MDIDGEYCIGHFVSYPHFSLSVLNFICLLVCWFVCLFLFFNHWIFTFLLESSFLELWLVWNLFVRIFNARLLFAYTNIAGWSSTTENANLIPQYKKKKTASTHTSRHSCWPTHIVHFHCEWHTRWITNKLGQCNFIPKMMSHIIVIDGFVVEYYVYGSDRAHTHTHMTYSQRLFAVCLFVYHLNVRFATF